MNTLNEKQEETNNHDQSAFFAAIGRMRFIQRWSLMHNTRLENVQEHSHQVTIIAHALALISNKFFNGDYDPDKIGMMASFHDSSEVLTGDMPTPVKYFSETIMDAYKKVELVAQYNLLDLLPKEFHDEYADLLCEDRIHPRDKHIIKAADTISAYLKCTEELRAGNKEFENAEVNLKEKLLGMSEELPAVHYFMTKFSKSFRQSIDMQIKPHSHKTAPERKDTMKNIAATIDFSG